MAKFLIAGGTGMIGSKLTKKLKQNNIEFVFLSTQKNANSLNFRYHWNPETDLFPEIDLKSFDAVINFCGAGIFDRSFSESRKRQLTDSRIRPILALHNAFKKQNVKVPYFISASATGLYPNISQDILDENSAHGDNFISHLVESWEKTAYECKDMAEVISTVRIGIVFSDTGGFLKPLEKTLKYMIAAIPGSGRQMISWIHVDDLCEMILFAINKKIAGPFNGTAPQPETLGNIYRQMALQLHRPLFLPNIPAFALRLIFGKERHELLLTDQQVRPNVMLENGFNFTFKDSTSAIKDLYPDE